MLAIFWKNTDMKIDLDSVPRNLDEAVDAIVAGISDEEREFIRTREQDYSTHFGVGMYLRNNWSLWEPECPLNRWFVEHLGIMHADDISGTIFAAVWAKVRGESFDPAAHAETYKKHWRERGIDPATMRQV